MRLAAVEKALSAFTGSDGHTTVALKGPWGRGKTFYWDGFIRSRPDVRAGLGYSYVSLFGLTSLTELRRAVALNARSLAGLNDPASMTLLEEALAAPSITRAFWKLSATPKPFAPLFESALNVGPVLDDLMQREVKDLIVCIDDLERRGEGLRLADVLGYCSHLKERRNCRVLVILNEEAFSPDDATEFSRLSEKVFDHQVIFEPSAEECVAIVLPANDERFGPLRGYCERLQMTNIRILQRTRRLAVDLSPFLKRLDARILDQVARTGALYSLCYYGSGGEQPPYEYVRAFRDRYFARMKGEESISSQERRWDAFLVDYGFTGEDELDREIAKYLESGYVDAATLRPLLETRSRELVEAGRRARFDKAWQALTASFEANDDAVLAELEASLSDASESIDVSFVNAVAYLARRLGKPEVATRVIERWVAVTAAKRPKGLDLTEEGGHKPGEIDDEELVRAISQAVEASSVPRSLDETLARLVEQEGWTAADVEVLLGATVADYEGVLRARRGEGLHAALSLCARISGESPSNSEIGAMVDQALRRIAKDGPLNEWRVGRYLKP